MIHRVWFLSVLAVGVSLSSALLGDDAQQVRELRERAAVLLREASDCDNSADARDLNERAADLIREAEVLVQRVEEEVKRRGAKEKPVIKEVPPRDEERRADEQRDNERRETERRAGEKREAERREQEAREQERRNAELREAERREQEAREQQRRADEGREEEQRRPAANIEERLAKLRLLIAELHLAGKHEFAEQLERQSHTVVDLLRSQRMDQASELLNRLLREVEEPQRVEGDRPRQQPQQCSPQERIAHILQAAEHLQAACMEEQAADLRRMAEQLKRELQPCPPCEQLQRQIEELSVQVRQTQDRVERIEQLLKERR